MQVRQLEREAYHRLPSLLATLLGLHVDEVEQRRSTAGDLGVDAAFEARGRIWLIEVKSSSSPGVVATAADRLHHYSEQTGIDALPLLVVPHMSRAGAETAAERALNWIDLSGNARLRNHDLYVWVEGRPNQFPRRGRPSTAFAPKSSRVSRVLLLDPWRWWRQKDLADVTRLDDGHLSRVVRRLDEDDLLDHHDAELRPRNPDLLLDAWADAYRFDRHDLLSGHLTGSGTELVTELHRRLADANIEYAFTGLPAAWALGQHARFRIVSVYVSGDPRQAADSVGLRRGERGANVQLIGPDDEGVFDGSREIGGHPTVSPAQVYLDLLHLPERAKEAARQLRDDGLLWTGP
ncbi:MAG: type IV toxin-antitoxin system AbiEi family antitoxin [Acidimicrobiia bacterium]